MSRKHLRCKSYRFSPSGKNSPIKMSRDGHSFLRQLYNLTRSTSKYARSQAISLKNAVATHNKHTAQTTKRSTAQQGHRHVLSFLFRPKRTCVSAEIRSRERTPRLCGQRIMRWKHSWNHLVHIYKVWYEQYTDYNICFIICVLSAS